MASDGDEETEAELVPEGGETGPDAYPEDRVADRFQLIRLLGQGGMGSVFEARELRLGRLVALKLMHPEMRREPRLCARFEREMSWLAASSHPGLPRVFDGGEDLRFGPFYTMERFRGDTLVARLERGALAPTEAVRVAGELLGSLKHLHAHGIVHRDLKPQNVFIDERRTRWRTVLLDLGVALDVSPHHRRRLTHRGEMIGTPRYMANEQLMGGDADERTDIYAVGALLHAMLVGRPPRWRMSEANLLQGAPHPPLDLRAEQPAMPRVLHDIVATATSPEAGDRYPTASEMRKALVASRTALKPALASQPSHRPLPPRS